MNVIALMCEGIYTYIYIDESSSQVTNACIYGFGDMNRARYLSSVGDLETIGAPRGDL